MRGDLLLLAFSAQGPGMQQWHAPCAAVRAAGLLLDTLYIADPSNSFYLQARVRVRVGVRVRVTVTVRVRVRVSSGI